MKDPSEFDAFQKDISSIPLNKSYAVQGSAGSGKTILALQRAQEIHNLAAAEGKKARFTIVVFSTLLKEFIKTGIQDLGYDMDQVVTYEQWDGDPIGYVLVDEAQDFTQSEIETLFNAAEISIMYYGDSSQQIFAGLKEEKVLSMKEISDELKIPLKQLTHNYRLPKLIADFAGHLMPEENLKHFCKREGADKPIIKKFNHWKEEIDYIFNEINERNFTDVGIFLPFNTQRKGLLNNFHRNMEDLRLYLDEMGYPYECKMSVDEGSENSIDFDTTTPKVMTFHSCKGLQFETVFIPFCDAPQHDSWFDNAYRKPYYVGLTRPYKFLYLTHSERLSPFFNKIPSSKYQ